MATFAGGGTYADPMTPSPLTGESIGQYAEQLWSAFPDLTFEVRSKTAGEGGSKTAGEGGLLAAERRCAGRIPRVSPVVRRPDAV